MESSPKETTTNFDYYLYSVGLGPPCHGMLEPIYAPVHPLWAAAADSSHANVGLQSVEGYSFSHK